MAKKPTKRPAPTAPPRSRPPKGRNEFGDPADTLYAGGTPLFDERTGKSVPRRKPKPATKSGR
jgi:hypothetical protein